MEQTRREAGAMAPFPPQRHLLRHLDTLLLLLLELGTVVFKHHTRGPSRMTLCFTGHATKLPLLPFLNSFPQASPGNTEGWSFCVWYSRVSNGNSPKPSMRIKDISHLDEGGKQQLSICLSAVLSVMETFSLSLGTAQKPKYVTAGTSFTLSRIAFLCNFPNHCSCVNSDP